MKCTSDEIKKAQAAAEWFRTTNNLEQITDAHGVLLAGCCLALSMLDDDVEGNLFDYRASCLKGLEETFHNSDIEAFVDKLFLGENLLCNRDGKHGFLGVVDQLPHDDEKLREIILDIDLEWELSKKQGRREIVAEMTPPSLAALAVEVLDINEGDTIADLGCATGAFITRTVKDVATGSVYGCDINAETAVRAAIRAYALDGDIKAEEADLFHVKGVFDKCFSNYPLGYKNPQLRDELAAAIESELGEALPKVASFDWLFNLQLLLKTTDNGKAIGIMTPGALYNGADAGVRRFLVEKGWVEAVISLPSRLFAHTGVPTMMIVLSRENEQVRFVDASEICQKGRRWNEFSEGDIAKIIELLGGGEADKATSVFSNELLLDEDCPLDPCRYVGAPIEVDNAVRLDSITTAITRGAMLSKTDLEEVSTDEETPFKYLMLQSINDGEIDCDLPFLARINPAQEKYCLQDGDVVVSKMGPNFKVATAQVAEGEKILATSNLYIIRPNSSKVDSLYLKAFIESEQGMQQLLRTSVGASIPSIPIKALKALRVALPSIEKQHGVAERYRELQGEIKMHRAMIAEAKEKLASVIEG